MNKNILVASADAGLCLKISDVLVNRGYGVITASNYDDSLEKIRNEKYFAVLLDAGLIDSFGIEMLINIYSYAASSPIIIMSGRDDIEEKTNFIKYGADEFILKNDINFELLEKTIGYTAIRNDFKLKIKKDYINLKNILEASSNKILIINDEKIIRHANLRAEVYFSRDNKPIAGTVFGYPVSLNKTLEHEAGGVVFEITGVPVTWNDENCIMVTLRDITKRKEYEKSIKDNEELFRIMFETINTGIALVDHDTGLIIEMNSILESLLRVDRNDVLNKKKCGDFLCVPEELSGSDDENIKIIKSESFVTDSLGGKVPVFKSVNLFNFSGKKYYLFSIIDKTEDLLKESIIRKRMNYENLIYNISTIFMYYYDIEDVFENIVAQLSNYLKPDFIELSIIRDDTVILKNSGDASLNERSIEDIFRLLMDNYYFIEMESSAKTAYYPINYEKKTIGYLCLKYLGRSDDFDEIDLDFFRIVSNIINNGLTRLLDIEKLNNNYAMLSKLLNTIPGPLFYKDISGIYKGCNDQFAELIVGLPVEKILGATVFNIDGSIPADKAELYAENERKLLKDLKTQITQETFSCRDGLKREYMVYKSVYNNLKGEVAGTITFMLDVTENERMKKQLIESEKLSAVGQLAAGVAHEFNNIMAIIKSTVQLIELKNEMKIISFDAETRQDIRSIDENIKRASDIVSSLMMISRPAETSLDYCQIKDVIDDVMKLQKKQFSVENINVEKDYGDVPDLLIDRGQMQQVFLNLSINARHAMQAMGHGTIYVSVKKNGEFVEVIFRDTGHGIKKEIRDKVFLPFFSTKGAHAKNNNLAVKGTGLGLSITQNLVQSHKGTIEVENGEGKGAAFRIRLPVPSPDMKIEAEGHDRRKNHVDRRLFDPDYKIAVLDMEKNIADNLRDILNLNGYKTVDSFYDPSVLTENPGSDYDLIISNFFMEGFNGNDFLKMLDQNNARAVMIFMTSNIEEYEKKIVENPRIESVVKKPFDSEKLIKLIDELSLKVY